MAILEFEAFTETSCLMRRSRWNGGVWRTRHITLSNSSAWNSIRLWRGSRIRWRLKAMAILPTHEIILHSRQTRSACLWFLRSPGDKFYLLTATMMTDSVMIKHLRA